MAFYDVILWVVIGLSVYISIWWLIALNVTLVESKLFDKESAKKYIFENINELPKVSVIVPLWNEENTVVGTLKSIINLDYPKDKLEILIVNDGSKDKSEENIFDFFKILKTKKRESKKIKTVSGIVRKIDLIQAKWKDIDIKYIHQPNSGKGVGLNVAISLLSGKYFAALDADSYVDNDTLLKMIATYHYQEEKNQRKVGAVTPAMMVHNPKTVIEYFQHYEYLMSMLAARIMSEHDMIYVTPGPFSLYDTQIIKSLEGFHENQRQILTEDQELAYRLQDNHYLIKQCANGYVYSKGPPTLKALIKQRNRWFKGSLICVALYKHMIWNKEYGDFGIQQMSINVLRVFLSVSVLYIFYEITIQPITKSLNNMYLYGFDIWPFLQNYKFSIDLLIWNYPRLLASLVIMGIGLLMLVLSFINAHKKIEKKDYKYIALFFFVYHIIMSFVMIKVIFELIIGKREWW